MTAAVARAFVEIIADDAQFRAASQRVESTAQRLQQRLEGIGRVARRAFLVGAGAMGGFVALAAQQENATRRLEAALRATGQSTVRWSRELLDASNRIQELTTFGNEAIQQMFTYATSLGVTADQLEKTTKQAIGLAQVTGLNQERAFRLMRLAQEGNTRALVRYLPELQNVQDATEAMRIINERAAQGWEMAQEEAKTFSGELAQLRNTASDVGKTIGAALIPSVRGLVEWVKRTIAPMEGWAARNQRLIAITTGLSAALLGTLAILPRLIITIRSLVTTIAALRAAVVALKTKLTILQATTIVGLVAALGTLVVMLARAGRQSEATRQSLDSLRSSLASVEAATEMLARARLRLARAEDDRDRLTQLQQQKTALDDMIVSMERQIELMRDTSRQEADRAKFLQAAREAGVAEEDLAEFDLDDFPFISMQEAQKLLALIRQRYEDVGEQVEDVRGRVEALDGAVPDEERTRSFLETARRGWRNLAAAMAEAHRQLMDARQEFAERLELFGATAQQRQLILLKRTRDELLEQAKHLGVLTDEMRRQITERFQAERQRIVGDPDVDAGEQVIRRRVEFVGLTDMFERIQSAIAGQEDPEKETARNTRRTAEGINKLARAEQRDARIGERTVDALESIDAKIDGIGTFAP